MLELVVTTNLLSPCGLGSALLCLLSMGGADGRCLCSTRDPRNSTSTACKGNSL